MSTTKPILRGVSHEWAFFAAIPTGIFLIVEADGPRATVGAAVFRHAV